MCVGVTFEICCVEMGDETEIAVVSDVYEALCVSCVCLCITTEEQNEWWNVN